MKTWKKLLIISGVCSLAGTAPVYASTNLETGSSLAGISVALNNYYAGTEQPEKTLADSYQQKETEQKTEQSTAQTAQTAQSQTSGTTGAQETKAAQSKESQKKSSYSNIAVSKVSSSVNIRTEANTSSAVTGKIYNDCAAQILDSVEGEGGTWYQIQSGSVTGFIKAEYFVTGEKAEARAKEVGKTYGTVVDTSTLRLRESPDLTSKTLTLLSEGAQYSVVGQEGDFLKVAVDTDLEGYVFKDYMKTNVEFNKAVSIEEEKAKEADEAKRKEEAEKALKELEEAKKAEAARKEEKKKEEKKKEEKKETVAVTTAAAKPAESETEKETVKETAPAVQVIAVNPEKGDTIATEAPVVTTAAVKETEAPVNKETEKETEKETVKETEAKKEESGSGSVEAASRNAVVAYAKQFLGRPYVYGGTSLTKGSDCSGFVMSVFAHFGISTGRTSRDQAARGKAISVSSVQPGDLLFYASGNYINHVGIYIGGGQIIHSSTPATGVCYAPSNYRTPCKAVTFFD